MGPGKPAGVIPAVSGASSGPALKSVSDAGQCEERGGLRAWSLLPSWDCSSNSWHGQEAGICNYRISTAVSRLSHRRTTANSALPPAEEQSRRRWHRPSCCPSSADTTEPLWDTAPSTSHCPTSDTKTTSCKTSPELQPRAQPGRAAASIPAALHRSLLLTAGPG